MPRRRSKLARAGTVLPLAIGLAMNAVTPREATGTGTETTLTATARGGGQQMFKPGCALPFVSHAVPDIDNHCTIDGKGKTAAKVAESHAKNNFCATGTVVPLTFDDFTKMQDDTAFKKSSADRSVLQSVINVGGRSVGEGVLAEYTGLIDDAHYSNRSNGEAVNCYIPGEDTNDIHIVVVQRSGEDPCNSVTAEMSPHFRPEHWTPDILNSLSRPVRFRGPLFYDSSHSPCRPGKRASPARASVWEIHPVYSVDVCTSSQDLAACKRSDATWVTLEEWLGREEEPEE